MGLYEDQMNVIRKKAMAATSGDWVVYGDSHLNGWEIEVDRSMKKIVRDDKGVIRREDAEYIAAVKPWVVLSLLDDIRLLTSELANVKAELKEYIDREADEEYEAKYADAPADYFIKPYLGK